MYSNLDMIYRIQKSNQRIIIYVYIQFGCDDRIEEKTENKQTKHTHTRTWKQTQVIMILSDVATTGHPQVEGMRGGGGRTHCLSHNMNIIQ